MSAFEARARRARRTAIAGGLFLVALALLAGAFPSGMPGSARSAAIAGSFAPPIRAASAVGPTLSIAGASPTTAGLSWTATSDPAFSEYEVERSAASSSGPWSTLGTLTSQSATTYYATGLAASTPYWWQVVEVDSLGVDLGSNVAEGTQPSTATLTVVSTTASSVHLSWVNHGSYGGSVRFVSYDIWQSEGGGAATSVGTITSESTTSAEAAGLTSGTSYTFQVETFDGCNGATNCGSSAASTYSNSVAATPAAAAPADFLVTFAETGLPSGTTWSVSLGGVTSNTTGSSIADSVPNGSYTYVVGGTPGFTASPSSGSLLVNGQAISRSVAFRSTAPGTYSVTFSETGLVGGTSWSVTLAGSTQTATGSTVVYAEPNGTDAFTIAAPSGYTARPGAGSVTIAGGPVASSITFTYSSGAPSVSITHVVLVMLENQEASAIWTGAPYERYLGNEYGNATAFYATCHDSSADYFAVTSGNTYGCRNVDPKPGFAGTEIGDLFEQHGLTWMAYEESMPSPCDLASSGYYINYHDPFIYYQDLNQNLSRCDAHVVSANSFNQSVASGDLPALSFYTPNWANDGHGPPNSPWSPSTGLSHIESWLREFLPPILNHTGPFNTAAERGLVNHTAFILLYDEGATDQGYTAGSVYTSGCYNQTGKQATACGGHVQVVVVSPYSVHRQFTEDATTYSVESTIEWLFGLPSDGGLDGTSIFPAMTTLFSFASNDYSQGHPATSPTPGAGNGGAPTRGGTSPIPAPFPWSDYLLVGGSTAAGSTLLVIAVVWIRTRRGPPSPPSTVRLPDN